MLDHPLIIEAIRQNPSCSVESWLSFFTPERLSRLLEAHGLTVAEQARQHDAVPAALWDRSDALRPLDLCRLARATVSP